ncbi:LysM peptidoglycan-binding domain-containing protein [Paenibacillus sp. N4]|uniref:LysM peptidoglycan-binding domain-containing protein n=1 Tax=Paenibacillus vietnamensis TaxID=2590547 RepID=UPI001CD0FA6A|nr:LysM peptidoglycan-binding domain-containing protein [Paenibacillus vietnamensis]MCA0755283.1 LysM peptidoglycan-binding domain-containing protein [Paenibacillus vietnamensis]
MSDQTSGLRFDVYERVHLPDDVAAIEELEEIELVPRIQVIDEGDHAVLKGQLLLSGIYRGQNGGDAPQTLEHHIPVEITLPMNRISRLDDISIDIDNFDVDLLSARTLNITGVLSLRGISAQQAEEQEQLWQEEPFTVVHEREAFEQQPGNGGFNQPPYYEQPYIAEEEEQAAEEPFSGFAAQQEEPYSAEEPAISISSVPSDNGWSSSHLFQPMQPAQPQRQEQEPESPDQELEREITLASQQINDEGWLASSPAFAETVIPDEAPAGSLAPHSPSPPHERSPFAADEAKPPQIEPALPQAVEQEPEKQELRIGLAGKPSSEGAGNGPNVGLSSLLQTSKREQAARQAAEEIEAQELNDAHAAASGDEIEWKNLFLGKRSEDKEFRKIRVCIVQRDETLDVIASRYSLNPREIMMYNRLDEGSVTEGQLLYIP